MQIRARERACWTPARQPKALRWCHSPCTRRCVYARALPAQRTHARRRPPAPPAPCQESGLLSHAAVLPRCRRQISAKTLSTRLAPATMAALRSTRHTAHYLTGWRHRKQRDARLRPNLFATAAENMPSAPDLCTSHDQPTAHAHRPDVHWFRPLPTHAASAATIHGIAALSEPPAPRR